MPSYIHRTFQSIFMLPSQNIRKHAPNQSIKNRLITHALLALSAELFYQSEYIFKYDKIVDSGQLQNFICL